MVHLLSSGSIVVKSHTCQVDPLLLGGSIVLSGYIVVKWFNCYHVVSLLSSGSIAVKWFNCFHVVPLLSSGSIAVVVPFLSGPLC